MKNLLLILVILIFSCNTVQAKEPPERIVLHSAVHGELPIHPLNCVVKPKKDLFLHEKPSVNSIIVSTVYKDFTAKITAFEIHTFPHKNKIVVEDNSIYFLTYRGEGFYSVWLNGKVQEINMETTKIVTNEEMWLCLQSPIDGLEGWVKFETKSDWYTEVGSGIFLSLNSIHLWK